jgi:peptidyl-prolyl cis-trans isomerase D
MGLMNKLRDKTHIILIILIVAFLATIVFEWGMDYMGLRGDEVTELGSVNGQDIKFADFENQVNFAIDQQRQQTGQDPDETLVAMIRDQVWDNMVTQILIEQEIKKLGINVTNQEILNWVYNSPQTLPDVIKRNFVDSTGQFNMETYKQALATKTPEVQTFWSQVEEYLKQNLLQQKLQSVITGTVRVTEGEVMQKFKDENIRANVDFVFFDVNSIPDNQIDISEQELRTYYDNNKSEFKREEAAKMRYVIFPDAATVEDTVLVQKQLRALVKDLRKLNPSDTTTWGVVNDNSLNKFSDTSFIAPNIIAAEVVPFLFTASKDSVSDVIMASDGLHIVRIVDSREGQSTFSNAAHILVNFGTDTNAAKQKADMIYQRLKNGEDFNKLAAENSDDPANKFTGGDLGWFTKGAMVKEFEDAVSAANIGDVIGPVKTQFGFHIIKVKGRSNKEFKFADIKKIVTASGRTKDIARKKAEDLVFISRNGNIDEEAKKLGIAIIDIPTPITKESFIPGAGQNKSVSRFAVTGSKGDISDPLKVQNGYAVYIITDKFPAGYTPFEEVKATLVMQKLKIEKKLDLIKPQAVDLKGKAGSDLNSLKNINPQINIVTADSISVAKAPPSVGADPDFNNAVFKLQNGQISEPIRTPRGYYLVQMKSIEPFNQAKYDLEYPAIRTQLITTKKQAIVQDWLGELKNKASIVDNRDKFYR